MRGMPTGPSLWNRCCFIGMPGAMPGIIVISKHLGPDCTPVALEPSGGRASMPLCKHLSRDGPIHHLHPFQSSMDQSFNLVDLPTEKAEVCIEFLDFFFHPLCLR